MWNTMPMDKAFCKSRDNSFGRSINVGKTNLYPEQVSISVSTQCCPSLWKLSSVINAADKPAYRQGQWALLEMCWTPLLED